MTCKGVLLIRFLDRIYYTLDKINISYRVRASTAEELGTFLAYQSHVKQRFSSQWTKCKYNYHVDLSFDRSFYIGIEPNSLPYDKFEKQIKIEFNPSKVGDDPFLQEMIRYLNANSYLTDRTIKRIDLAIDIPIARERLTLVKDGRTIREYASVLVELDKKGKPLPYVYEEISNSISDKTQYLGRRNKHGFVKLYNKALESGLKNIDLTRLEITIDYKNSDITEITRLLPIIYIFDDFQFDSKITGTDKVLLIACINEPSLLTELPHTKKKKITSFLEKMKLPLEIDEIAYNRVIEEATNIIKY